MKRMYTKRTVGLGQVANRSPWLGVLALVAVLAVPAAAQAANLAFSPPSSSVDCGETVDVDVTVADVIDLRGFSIYVEYDPAVVTVANVAVGSGLAGAACGNFLNDYDPAGGVLRVDGSLLGCSLDAGTAVSLFTITFSPATTKDSSNLTFGVQSALRDSENGTIDRSLGTGSVANICNTAPVASDDGYTVAENGTLTATASGSPAGVLDNDSDIDATDVLTATIVSGPTSASSFSLAPNGSFTYVQDGSEVTTDSFVYEVNDGDGGTAQATATITITPVNDAPVAVDDTGTVAEGGAISIGVLANDSDVDLPAQTLSILSVTQGANGTVAIDGVNVIYTHDAGETTSDEFTYVVDDGNGGTDTATVTVTVTPVNDAPVAADDADTVAEGGTVDIPVLVNDSDVDVPTQTLVIQSVTQGAYGTVAINGADVTYIHDGSETISDTFDYVVRDGNGGTDTGTVTITVTAVNDDPVAVDDAGIVVEGQFVDIAVLVNDSDAETAQGLLSIQSVTQGANGAVVINGTYVTYTHNGSETTADSFEYVVSDGAGGTDTGTVTITVTPVNDVPIAVDDTASVDEGQSVDIPVLANDSDAETAQVALTIQSVTQGTNGTVVVNGTNATYTHDGSETATDTFTYVVSDGTGGAATGTVTITVNGVNDPPGVTTPTDQTNLVLDTPTLQILATDPESGTLTYTATGLPGGLTLDSGSGLISGAIDCGADTSSPYTVIVTVADNGAPIQETIVTFAWTVGPLPAPAPLTGLVATQLKSSNDTDGTTKITLTWATGAGYAEARIFRKAFGGYPEYTGAVPAALAVDATPADAEIAGWTEVTLDPITGTTYVDEPATRDFWYYVAFAENACTGTSGPSTMTGGTLNYHLGDVTDGFTYGQGDNAVATVDITYLGNNYADVPDGNTNVLDVGPTTDLSVDARPVPDDEIEFEDLILFAINFNDVGKTEDAPAPADRNLLTLFVPEHPADGRLEVSLWLAADATLKGASIPLTWNADVVAPVGYAAGELMTAQSGQNLVLSPEPGTVDFALFGATDAGISGEGLLATVTFEILGEGDPDIAVGDIRARDLENNRQDLDSTVKAGTLEQMEIPDISVLYNNFPNPFNPTTTLKYGVAVAGQVSLVVYDVRGRVVTTLVNEAQRPGTYRVIWDGTDQSGRRVASGVYLSRLQAVDRTQVQRMMLVK